MIEHLAADVRLAEAYAVPDQELVNGQSRLTDYCWPLHLRRTLAFYASAANNRQQKHYVFRSSVRPLSLRPCT